MFVNIMQALSLHTKWKGDLNKRFAERNKKSVAYYGIMSHRVPL